MAWQMLVLAAAALAARGEVAATAHFRFYSDARVNLHDELNRTSRNDPEAQAPPCVSRLEDPARRGWSEAAAFYRNRLSSLELRGETLAAVRAHFLGAATKDPLVDETLRQLARARPAYQACFWDARDRANRAWIAAVAPRVRAHEQALTARLSRLFRAPWPEAPIPVDVVAWVSRAGANTIDAPPHIMISSVDPGYRDDAGLEMTFHEASHLLVDARSGPIAEAIASALGERMLPRRDLWHTILFFTVGQATRERLADTGEPGYVPYLYAQGLIERGWRPYRQPLERHWQAYLDGEDDLETATRRLVGAIFAPAQ